MIVVIYMDHFIHFIYLCSIIKHLFPPFRVGIPLSPPPYMGIFTARSVSGTNQVVLDLGYSNLVSGACAEGFLGGLQPLEVVGEFLNGRCILVHLTVSQPARGFVSDHPERHIHVADDVL